MKEYYSGGRWHERSFDKVNQYYEQKTLVATGSGVPRSHSSRAGSAEQPSQPSEPEWARQYIRATGSGVPPEDVTDPGQAGLLAERAAEVDAKRNLLERIYGIRVDSSTYIRDYVAEHDEASTRLNAFLAGAKKVDTRYLDDGVVEVDVEAPLSGVWDIVKTYSWN